MGSLRTPGVGETVASDAQPSGYHNAGETVQNVGAMLWTGGGWAPAINAQEMADGNPGENVAPVAPVLYDQVTGSYDRQRNNIVAEVGIALGARTGEQHTALIHNYNHTKCHVYLNIESAGTGKLQLGVYGGPGAGFVGLFTPVSVSTRYQFAPGLPNALGGGTPTSEPKAQVQTLNLVVPGEMELWVQPSDGSSWTYELVYDLLV
jgi:hypothetical protein